MSDEPFKSTGLFKKYTIKNKIFQNREVLRHSYSPRELPHRVDQIDSIAVILAPALQGATPSNILIYGKTGTGKTATVKFVGSELENESSEFSPCRMVHLNCESLTAITKTVLPFMGSKSRMIQVASTAAYLPQPGFSVYAATKSYVYSFSKSLNEELRSRKITVTAVCPGPANTEFFQVAASEKKEPFYKKLFLADPKKVVKKAIKDCSKGRNESTYGIAMKLIKILSKLVPNNLVIRVIGWMQEVTS